LDELYYADCDGAFLNGERLEIVPNNQDKNQIFAITGNNLPAITIHERDLVNYRNFREINSAAVVYAWVAAGRLKGYYLRADSKWDYLPGMYLVKMAGGLTKNCQGNHIAAADQKMLDHFDKIFASETAKKNETKKAIKPNGQTASKTK
jgi:fructose-1,6-bisphosphatase/inositol monophosphatase family enzyme